MLGFESYVSIHACLALVPQVLMPKLRDPDFNVASAVLSTLGKLASISGEDMLSSLDQLMPQIINILQDKGSRVKREVRAADLLLRVCFASHLPARSSDFWSYC